jgi:hypothetical protein
MNLTNQKKLHDNMCESRGGGGFGGFFIIDPCAY